MKMTENWTIFAMKFLKSYNNHRVLIVFSGFLIGTITSDLGLGQSDHINRMITLTGFCCTSLE